MVVVGDEALEGSFSLFSSGMVEAVLGVNGAALILKDDNDADDDAGDAGDDGINGAALALNDGDSSLMLLLMLVSTGRLMVTADFVGSLNDACLSNFSAIRFLMSSAVDMGNARCCGAGLNRGTFGEEAYVYDRLVSCFCWCLCCGREGINRGTLGEGADLTY